MIDHNKTVSELNLNSESLFNFLDEIDENKLTDQPDPEKWSLMQTVDHLFQVEKGVNFLFTGPVILEDRDPTMKIPKIEKDFMDFTRKFKAAGPIIPKGQFDDLAGVKNAILKNRKMLTEIGNSRGWEETCVGLEHALFGTLTRIEWIWFSIIHTNRHLIQMKDLLLIPDK